MAVTIDTVAPAAPVSPMTSVNGSNVTFTGTAEANSTVKVFDGATLLGTATTNGSGAWSYTTGTLPDGAQIFTATATDVAGNTSSSFERDCSSRDGDPGRWLNQPDRDCQPLLS